MEKIIVAPKPGQQIRGCIPCIQGVCENEGECTIPNFARTFARLKSSKRYLNENQLNGNMYGYKIVKEKGLLLRIYHKLCSLDILRECTMRWLHHTVCKVPPVRKKKTSLQSLISFLTTKSYRRQAIYIGKTVTKDLKKSATIGSFQKKNETKSRFPLSFWLSSTSK